MSVFSSIKYMYETGMMTREQALDECVEWLHEGDIFDEEEGEFFDEACGWYGGDAICLMLDNTMEEAKEKLEQLEKDAYEYWEAQERYEKIWGFDKVVYEAGAVL